LVISPVISPLKPLGIASVLLLVSRIQNKSGKIPLEIFKLDQKTLEELTIVSYTSHTNADVLGELQIIAHVAISICSLLPSIFFSAFQNDSFENQHYVTVTTARTRIILASVNLAVLTSRTSTLECLNLKRPILMVS